MDGSNIPMAGAGGCIYPSSYSKFNNALNAGLLNPMSPPPPPLSSPSDKLVNATTRSSPTLFEMMANEHESVAAGANVMNPTTRSTSSSYHVNQSNPSLVNGRQQQHPPPLSVQERQLLLQERVMDIMGCSSPGNQLNDPETSDVRLTLSSKDGLSITINVHRQILVAHSRFFAAKLTDRWSKQQRSLPHLVEISDCDDVEIYVETLRLMYCSDIRRRLLREDVPKILSVLKVCAAISFDAGVLSCLEYLEAAPWAEDEEEKVAGLLSQLHLESSGAAGEVLKRVMPQPLSSPLLLSSTTTTGGEGPINGNGSCAFNLNGSEEVLLRLLQVVLEGKDEKARREMKDLVSKMLRENNKNNSSNNNGGNNNSNNQDVSQESLYVACEGCLNLLRHHFTKAATSDLGEVSQIARQADNLHWLLDILIDRQIADNFLRTWASQTDLSEIHPKVAAIHRYEISRVTARLFIGIGKGQILVSKNTRCLLLRTWLDPFYEDFGWMRRACKGLDRHSIEDGLGNTILTLPLGTQQEILLAWFDRFLNSGDDCPNLQRGFEVWWRRAFWRRHGEAERQQLPRIAAANSDCNN